uniref:Uncharacterized protein n=1 Tax=Meloidogyne incognita TaxID=6306 RepID=A0A914NF97_MELIC
MSNTKYFPKIQPYNITPRYRPKTPHFSKTRYNTLNFLSGHFGATLKCGTKMTMPIKLLMTVYLISPQVPSNSHQPFPRYKKGTKDRYP